MRWRRLLKDQFECSTDDVSAVVIAACALHNLCEKINDTVPSSWESELVEEPRTTRSRARQQQQESEAGEQVALVKDALGKHFLAEQSAFAIRTAADSH